VLVSSKNDKITEIMNEITEVVNENNRNNEFSNIN
jgi:hypothetical protein